MSSSEQFVNRRSTVQSCPSAQNQTEFDFTQEPRTQLGPVSQPPRWRFDRHAQVQIVCQHCAATVTRASRGKRPPQKYCGNACAAAAAKALGKFRGENNPSFRGWKSRDKVAYRERFQARYPEKAAAHKAVQDAVRAGRLTRQPCEVCGAPKAHAHHDSYAPEHRLDVRWLCRPHHRAWHEVNDRPMGPKGGAR